LNIGVIGTRLAGTDGVSLESGKIAEILTGMGHRIHLCAGELDDASSGRLVPELHFAHPGIRRLHDLAFGGGRHANLIDEIQRAADHLRRSIDAFVRSDSIDLLFPQNALAIPMNLPLGVALTDYLAATRLPAIAHHHDFYWERSRFSASPIAPLLDRCFPPAIPTIRHLVINSLARDALRARRGLESLVLPNVLDFETGPATRSEPLADLRAAVGVDPADFVVLQPTRVVPRKGIEIAIDLVRALAARLEPGRRVPLVVSHAAGDEGMAYAEWLRARAAAAGVDLRFAADRFGEPRRIIDGQIRRLDLQDGYALADLVSYPSLYEGFGNAFLEAVFYRRPLFVNRYPVYIADIEPLGFDVVAIDGTVTADAVDDLAARLRDPARAAEIADRNYQAASAHFSYSVARRSLSNVLASLS